VSGYEASTGPEDRDNGPFRQDPLAIAASGSSPIAFELVIFDPVSGSPDGSRTVDVTVCGMWTGPAPVVSVYDDSSRLVLDVAGVDDGGRARPYRVTIGVDIGDQRELVVRGARSEDRLLLDDLGDLAVVCGPDPLVAGLAGPFLHRRGDTLVRVDPGAPDGRRSARRSSVNLVA
jgi:hypothetical protein